MKDQYVLSLRQNSNDTSKFHTLGIKNVFLVMKNNIFDGSVINKKEPIRLLHIASNTYMDFSKIENS